MKAHSIGLGAICRVLFAATCCAEPGVVKAGVFEINTFGQSLGFATLIVMFVGPATDLMAFRRYVQLHTASGNLCSCGIYHFWSHGPTTSKEVSSVVSEEAQLESYKASLAI